MRCQHEYTVLETLKMSLIWNSSVANVLLLVCIDLLLGCPALAATELFGLRLTGGQSELEGRLEIEYSPGQWGSICDDEWDWPATFVACNQLGHGPPLDQHLTVQTDFSIPIAYDNVVCQGNESRLVDCNHLGVRNHDCTHEEDVTIRCASPTGIPDYTVETVRGLEMVHLFGLIYFNSSWYMICQSILGRNDVGILCRQLGFSQPNTQLIQMYFTTSVPVVFQSYECLSMVPACIGTENHLGDCEWIGTGSPDPLYLDFTCDVSMSTTEYYYYSPGYVDSSGLSPLFTLFLVLLGLMVLLVVICKIFQQAQCDEAGCCQSCENQATQQQVHQAPVQVIAIRSLEEDEDFSMYTQYVTEVQELPDDVPPSYDQYINNPALFRTFSEVRGSEAPESNNSEAEETVESPPPDYESATFGFSVDETDSEDGSLDTRL